MKLFDKAREISTIPEQLRAIPQMIVATFFIAVLALVLAVGGLIRGN